MRTLPMMTGHRASTCCRGWTPGITYGMTSATSNNTSFEGNDREEVQGLKPPRADAAQLYTKSSQVDQILKHEILRTTSRGHIWYDSCVGGR